MPQTAQKPKITIRVGRLIRNCENYKKDQRVYEYPFHTYGAVLDSEQAIMLDPNSLSIDCIDRTAVEWTKETAERDGGLD
jgi:hypothetical protein